MYNNYMKQKPSPYRTTNKRRPKMKNLDEKRIKELLAKEAKLNALQADVDEKKRKELRYSAKQSLLLHKAKLMFGMPSDADADLWIADKEGVKLNIAVEVKGLKDKVTA